MVSKVMTIEEEMNLIRKDERAIGEREGEKKGIKKGIKKGERENTIKVAKVSLETGLSKDVIAKITGLYLNSACFLRLVWHRFCRANHHINHTS